MEKRDQTLDTDQPFQQSGAADIQNNLLGWERGRRAARGWEWRPCSKEVCSDEKQLCKSWRSRARFQAGEELVLPRAEDIMSQGIKNRSCKIHVPAWQVQTEGPTSSHSILKCTPLHEAAGEGANSSQLMGICEETIRQRTWKKENSLRPKICLYTVRQKVLGVLR